jgi:hypothetical protein
MRQAKALAAEQGRPLRDLVAEALEDRVRRRPAGPHAAFIPGVREGRPETWEEYRSKFVEQPDGTLVNSDAIDDESFYAALDEIRRRPFVRRNPFAGQD